MKRKACVDDKEREHVCITYYIAVRNPNCRSPIWDLAASGMN